MELKGLVISFLVGSRRADHLVIQPADSALRRHARGAFVYIRSATPGAKGGSSVSSNQLGRQPRGKEGEGQMKNVPR